MGLRQEYDDSSAPPSVTEEEDTTDKPRPIGVPEDYPIPGGAPGIYTPYERKAAVEHGQEPLSSRYMVGDEWLPANYPGDMLYMLQQQLVQAGLLTSSFTAGVFDPQTREAYRELLGLANAAGQDANNTLAQMVANAAAAPQPPAEPLVTQTTDPTVLRQAFRRSIIDLRGEGWSREQINDMVSAYNQLEVQRQREAYDLQQSGESGNVINIPSPQDFIESQVMEKDPAGVQEEEALGFLGDFMNMATGSAWNG